MATSNIGNIGEVAGKRNALAKLSSESSSYPEYLKLVASTFPGQPMGKEANALLEVTDANGNIDPAFIADPYKYTGTDQGQVGEGYGPQGLSVVSGEFDQGWSAGQAAVQKNAGGTANPDAAAISSLRNEIKGRGADIESVYSSLFGDLNNLVTSRDSSLEKQYGDQFKGASDTYAGAIPEIENSYAAIGSSDSTDQSDAKDKAKLGFDATTKTIGDNKTADKVKLGQYKTEQEAKFAADKASASRNVARADETTDVNALRTMRNDLENNIDQAGITRATLGTDVGAKGAITNLTQDAGRYEAATNALDSIIKSSMSGSVKEAAVKAVTDNAGLSDEEKKKVQAQYGNVYAEQAAL